MGDFVYQQTLTFDRITNQRLSFRDGPSIQPDDDNDDRFEFDDNGLTIGPYLGFIRINGFDSPVFEGRDANGNFNQFIVHYPGRPIEEADAPVLMPTLVAQPFDFGEFARESPTDGDDRVIGIRFEDNLSLLDGDDFFNGRAGDDSANGGDGNDRLLGGAGSDRLIGFDGNDILRGGNGTDNLSGGDGDDRLFGGGGEDVIFGSDGNDRAFGDGGDDNLSGGDGDDLLDGGNGDDQLFGGDGNNTLRGGKGGDLLFGGDDQDSLSGGRGADSLVGEAGRDMLNGGRGDDRLRGGEDADVFVFEKRSGNDNIRDFEDNIDTVQLDSALWVGTLSKAQVINRFASVVDDSIVFDFGRDTLTFDDVTDLGSLRNDLEIV